MLLLGSGRHRVRRVLLLLLLLLLRLAIRHKAAVLPQYWRRLVSCRGLLAISRLIVRRGTLVVRRRGALRRERVWLNVLLGLLLLLMVLLVRSSRRERGAVVLRVVLSRVGVAVALALIVRALGRILVSKGPSMAVQTGQTLTTLGLWRNEPTPLRTPLSPLEWLPLLELLLAAWPPLPPARGDPGGLLLLLLLPPPPCPAPPMRFANAPSLPSGDGGGFECEEDPPLPGA